MHVPVLPLRVACHLDENLLSRVILDDLLPSQPPTCLAVSSQRLEAFIVCCLTAGSFRLASDCNSRCRDLSCAARRFLPPSLMSKSWNLSILALPLTHEFGFMPNNNGTEAQIFLVFGHHVHVVQLARLTLLGVCRTLVPFRNSQVPTDSELL